MRLIDVCKAIHEGKTVQFCYLQSEFQESKEQWITYNPTTRSKVSPLVPNDRIEWRIKGPIKKEYVDKYSKRLVSCNKYTKDEVIAAYLSGWGNCIDVIHESRFLTTKEANIFRE